MVDHVHDAIAGQLRRARQRYTTGRRQLVETLLALARPATIPELVDHGAVQSQSSLYRNLAVLEQAGAVRRIPSMDDTARYELAEELTEHHHHLVCSTCGRVDDVVLSTTLEQALGEAAGAARRQRGYVVDSHRLEFVGTCPGCT